MTGMIQYKIMYFINITLNTYALVTYIDSIDLSK